MLKVLGRKIVDGTKEVVLRGVNLGGWLMPEGYIMHAPNRGYRFFKADFIKTNGEKMFNEIETAFRDSFITEKDIALIKSFGLNSIRVPFHYGLIETKPFTYSKEGVSYLDRVIGWAKKYELWVILDMHAAPGAQNHDWHSDSDGRALFWSNATFRRRAIALWQFLANRYKNEPAVAGYDILNETVLDDAGPLNQYYHDAIKAIREVDSLHIIFVEGNRWAQDLACFDEFSDYNLAFSFHFYEPLEFTFNWVPGLKYPLVSSQGRFDKATLHTRLSAAEEVADRCTRPLWCGEFGVNARDGFYGEDRWLKDILFNFNKFGIHWTYWTWKAIKNGMYPDGVYSYIPNDLWVNRQGPEFGWDTWVKHWPKHKKEMIASWHTERFTQNTDIVNTLKEGAR